MKNEDDDSRVTVWQCIGCGKIEYPQPCIGVCQDRKIDLVYDFAYREAVEREREAHRQSELLAALVRQIAYTTPRNGQWKRSWQALQKQARDVLERAGNP
ncbi:MAG: hypothetical protein DWQ08_02855 [Proteobacteria bacterium]|nr:MAG: hypothetical protein DWQ08_02855 [Pseudomonadota bacterium]